MIREHISLTLDKNLLSRIDGTIDGEQIRNRSHAIEILLSKALSESSVKKALILVGGKGTRLRPITYEIPKPMVPIHGRPLLEYTIDFLRDSGVREIILAIGYLGHKIKEYFSDGAKFGVKISYVDEKEPLGTSGPVRAAKNMLYNSNFIVINGDNLFTLDLNNMVMSHFNNSCIATIALTTVDDPSKFGVARLKGNKILEFIEKPKLEDAPSKLVNAGVYLFSPKIFDYIPEKSYSMFETDVFPKLLREGQFYGYVMEGQWLPAGTPEEYERAIKEWKK